MSLCNLCHWNCPRKHFTVTVSPVETIQCTHYKLLKQIVCQLWQKDHHSENWSAGWPLDVLMCEIIILWHNTRRTRLAIHMWPYLLNGLLIWADRPAVGSHGSHVVRLTRNKAEINFLWSLCGAFFRMALCLCPREHLLHFCWPLCPFPCEHVAPFEMITAFQSVVKTTGHPIFSKPRWLLKHLTTVTREINLVRLSIWV